MTTITAVAMEVDERLGASRLAEAGVVVAVVAEAVATTPTVSTLVSLISLQSRHLGPPPPQPLARGVYNYGGYGDDAYSGGGYGGGGYGSGGYEAGPPTGGYDPYAAGYGGGGGGGGSYGDVGPTKVFMRGLPFRVTFREVEEFFAPIVCVDVKFGVLPDARASGDGIVEFRTPADAQLALQKDRGCISNR